MPTPSAWRAPRRPARPRRAWSGAASPRSGGWRTCGAGDTRSASRRGATDGRHVHATRPWAGFGEDLGLVYKSTSELTADELRKYVKEVRIPPNRTGHFKADVFDKTTGVVSDAWHRPFQDVEAGNADACRAYLKNWNLDEGAARRGAVRVRAGLAIELSLERIP